MIESDGITVAELQSIHPFGYRTACKYVSKLQQYWCPFMVSNRKCDRMCTVTCAEYVQSVVYNFKGEQAPIGIVVWRIRNLKAKLVEQWSAQEKEPIKRNKLGEVVNRNPFEQLRSNI